MKRITAVGEVTASATSTSPWNVPAGGVKLTISPGGPGGVSFAAPGVGQTKKPSPPPGTRP